MQIEQRIEGMEIKLRQIVKGGNNEKCKEIRNCSYYRTYFNGTHCNFLPPSEEILSFNVVWLLCIGVFAFAQGELEHNAGRKGFSWMTIGCFVLGILINIGTGTGDMLGGMIGLASMIILYILGKEYALYCKK